VEEILWGDMLFAEMLKGLIGALPGFENSE
jgi:hypothetical protein